MVLTAFILLSLGSTAAQAGSTGSSRFFRELYEQPGTTRADAVRAVCFIVNQDSPAWTYDEALAILKETRVIPRNWKIKGDLPLTKGFLCNLILRALQKKCSEQGGMMVRMWGVNDRSAYRECLHNQIVSAGGEGKAVAGSELVGAVSQASRFLRERRDYK